MDDESYPIRETLYPGYTIKIDALPSDNPKDIAAKMCEAINADRRSLAVATLEGATVQVQILGTYYTYGIEFDYEPEDGELLN